MKGRGYRWGATLALVASLALECLVARAQTAPKAAPSWFAGVGAGESLINAQFAPTEDFGSGDHGYIVHGGLRINRRYAVDLAYVRARGLTWSEYVLGVSDLPSIYDGALRLDVSSLQLSAMRIFPFGSVWEASLKGGLASSRASGREQLTDEFSGARLTRVFSTAAFGFLFAFDIGANVTPNWHVALEWQSFRFKPPFLGHDRKLITTIDTWSMSAEHRFGRKKR